MVDNGKAGILVCMAVTRKPNQIREIAGGRVISSVVRRTFSEHDILQLDPNATSRLMQLRESPVYIIALTYAKHHHND